MGLHKKGVTPLPRLRKRESQDRGGSFYPLRGIELPIGGGGKPAEVRVKRSFRRRVVKNGRSRSSIIFPEEKEGL